MKNLASNIKNHIVQHKCNHADDVNDIPKKLRAICLRMKTTSPCEAFKLEKKLCYAYFSIVYINFE